MFDSRGNRKYLNALERTRFHKAINAATVPEQALLFTLFFTGCRLSEALALTVENLDSSEKKLIFRTLKQRGKRRFRAVPIPDSLSTRLAVYASDEPYQPLWELSRTTAWRIVKRCMARAKIDGAKATPKGLRHSFAIACISEGVPLTTVQKWMGHARLETTAIYLEFAGEDERRLAKRVWKKVQGKG